MLFVSGGWNPQFQNMICAKLPAICVMYRIKNIHRAWKQKYQIFKQWKTASGATVLNRKLFSPCFWYSYYIGDVCFIYQSLMQTCKTRYLWPIPVILQAVTFLHVEQFICWVNWSNRWSMLLQEDSIEYFCWMCKGLSHILSNCVVGSSRRTGAIGMSVVALFCCVSCKKLFALLTIFFLRSH